MTRLIDANALTDDVILHYLGRPYSSCLPDIRDMLAETPTVDAEPIVHAHWENVCEYVWGTVIYKCSSCGRRLEINKANLHKYPYCHCGAKMDEEVNHEADI